MKTSLLNIIFIALFFGSFISKGQTTVDSLQTIEIKASRNKSNLNSLPASISIIGKEQIQSNRTGIFLEEVLKTAPGVFVQNRYNFSQGERIIIRGQGSRSAFGLRNIRVFLDGIPLTSADGTSQLTGVDLLSISSVEVLRGPASQIYGNSSGGVLYLKSDLSSKKGTALENFLMSGSFGLFKAGLKFAKTTNKASFLVSGNVTDVKGFRDFSNSRFYTLNASIKKQLKRDYTLTWLVNGYYAPFLYNPGGLTKTETSNPQITRTAVKKSASGKTVLQGITGVNLIKKLRKNQEIDLTAFMLTRKLDNPIIGRYIDLNRYTGGVRAAYIRNIEWGKTSLHLRTGFDSEYQADKRNEYVNNGVTDIALATLSAKDLIAHVQKGNLLLRQNEHIANSGLYVLGNLEREKLKITAALRYDIIRFSVKDLLNDSINQSGSKTFSKLNPGAGLIYRINAGTHVYSNFATSFQTPTANEFSNTINGSGFNKQLQPERTYSYEAGIRMFRKIFYIDFAAFYFRTNNQLIPYQIPGSGDQVFYRNASATQNKGMEISGYLIPIKRMKLNLSYTIMDYKFLDYAYSYKGQVFQLEGYNVPGVANQRLFSGASYSVKNLVLEFGGQWCGKMYVNDLNGPEPGIQANKDAYVNKSYWTFDTKAGYTVESGSVAFNIFGGINNIFNSSYNGSIIPNAANQRYFEPSPTRNYYIGLTTSLRK